jgi:aspartate dehydrogenase
MTVSVLIIGYGAIAGYVANRLAGDDEVSIDWVLARPGREDAAAAAIGGTARTIDSASALDGQPDVAIECAGHGALREHGAAILEQGIPLAVVSVGAFADETLARRAAIAGGTRIDLLSGAIGAVDAISAAREGGLDRVTYTSRKPPSSWAGTPAEEVCDLAALDAPVAFFRGAAREAARLYPKNANVAATIALAGLGLDVTDVVLTADPTATGNIHHVEAEGAFGKLDLTIEGKPLPDNPKSSALTAMSAVRYLRDLARPVRM